MKKYRFGFDVWALVLFFIIMIPNFVWFVVPAPNDILRGESITKTGLIIFPCLTFLFFAIDRIYRFSIRKSTRYHWKDMLRYNEYHQSKNVYQSIRLLLVRYGKGTD